MIHLLQPATEELGGTYLEGGCISDAWADYPYAVRAARPLPAFAHADLFDDAQFGLCLLSLFLTFVTQIVAFRLGTARLAKLGNSAPPHVHVMGHPGHVQEQDRIASRPSGIMEDSAATAASQGSADSLEKGDFASDRESKEDSFVDASEQNPIIAQVSPRHSRNEKRTC